MMCTCSFSQLVLCLMSSSRPSAIASGAFVRLEEERTDLPKSNLFQAALTQAKPGYTVLKATAPTAKVSSAPIGTPQQLPRRVHILPDIPVIGQVVEVTLEGLFALTHV
jgi:hypothetical protein